MEVVFNDEMEYKNSSRQSIPMTVNNIINMAKITVELRYKLKKSK